MQEGSKVAIFDGHNDVAQHLVEYREGGRDFLVRSEEGHLDLPRAREGGMVGGLFAMYAKAEHARQGDFTQTADGYEVRLAEPLDAAYARRTIDAQLSALERLVGRANGRIRFATTVDEIEAARRDAAFAIVLHLEGAEAIDADLDGLARLHSRGLRSLGPVWSRPNIFGHGVPFAYPRSPDTGPGLTDAGKALVKTCNELGIMVDAAHLNERGFWDLVAISTAPIVATHACAHAICPATRNLTDRQLDAVKASGGVVGFNFSVSEVRPDGHRDPDIPIETVVAHLGYLVERMGDDHVALGSDFDGATMPHPLRDASQLQNLIQALRAHGFDEATLRKIAFDNWMRMLRQSWR
ncbi:MULTISPECIES: dipeptidase [Bradyrhizobium]|jgi:membrane dipeptidase|uniref:dipeptidase n=1 Tax=Bradyrhizobium TaxID=374 RepID=UPI0004674AF9|nr:MULTISPECIES: dipeptidase [Bradyrhizobium]KIU43007.1 peptidase [Bradyrhizobium elkanii]MBK5656337.1 dipeptidase [Rhizobium sp.]OCX31097.1 peptidase [Bradyrhizobium sp. UASWS1016]